ncbi:hypothetical protein FOZ63_007882 [Perkinsus olseni]|uniref:Uncharacterized protein n=1 Tax=Perkinsus olseni TaxID=32597 RepID=A0A7J6RJC0_PEROL|nr:hypothetical protein FOZ63_007882 [Perkinsus olseni]
MSNTNTTGEDPNRPGNGEHPENPLLVHNVNRPGAVRGRPSGAPPEAHPAPPPPPPQGPAATGNVFHFGQPQQQQQQAPFNGPTQQQTPDVASQVVAIGSTL